MTKSTTTIVLFTQWFPYNKLHEQSFLAEELVYLRRHFEEVILVPKLIEGDLYEVPEGITVDTSLAERIQQMTWGVKISCLTSPLFIREILGPGRDRLKFRFALAKMLVAQTTKRWLIGKFGHRKNALILYSFWMDSQALGALLSRSRLPAAKVITRCHNYDIYGNEGNRFYVPYFRYSYPRFDAVFPDSLPGEEYLRAHVPGIHLKPGIMGVSDPGFVNEGSGDGVFRIISCAYMIERKRVSLFAHSLLLFARKYPDIQLEWYHIGEGPELEAVREVETDLADTKCAMFLLGNMDNADMLQFYHDTPLDVFVNTSTHEGTPVSLMEAISCGIPLLVSDCGGNVVMAEKGGGLSFPVSANESEIAERLHAVIAEWSSDKNQWKQRKDSARATWERYYNSDRNYTEFCEELKNLGA